jgi:hypothetical protein
LKLNAHGFAHDFIIVAVIVVVSIAGVGYIVASHADDCPTTVSVSVTAAGHNIAPSCTADAKPTTPLSASCVIRGVTATPRYGQVIAATAVISVSQGKGNYYLGRVYDAIYQTNAVTHSVGFLKPVPAGSIVALNLPKYTVAYAIPNKKLAYEKYEVWWGSTSNVSASDTCRTQFLLPVQQVH